MLGRARTGCAGGRKVMAVVWNYFSRQSNMAGNPPAILCIGSTEVFSIVGWLGLSDGAG